MKITKRSWPVPIFSAQFDPINDQGFRLKELVVNLAKVQELTVHPSFSYEDAIEIFMSRCDLGAVIIDWDIGSEDSDEGMEPEQLLNLIRARNRHIPIILLTSLFQGTTPAGQDAISVPGDSRPGNGSRLWLITAW